MELFSTILSIVGSLLTIIATLVAFKSGKNKSGKGNMAIILLLVMILLLFLINIFSVNHTIIGIKGNKNSNNEIQIK